ncbi:Chitooligosaccharide deacetylase [Rhodovastum atsumiense]|uniref:Chitooligosaccharide deacetylase n=1 Tax=Rhodovastum atsumiense TaxID=504468 RepID=A0A5M6IWG8_9PROT|nr:polysaccharide deacetylase family protein [Rhodovastum atsumiense]KAA5612571.1 polysaccharide deacetylase family protein [Rhodovastum atsumiense]CAH2601342.1 Chitooligosaccharide deacetylase [Rhodovastum atsumiense]
MIFPRLPGALLALCLCFGQAGAAVPDPGAAPRVGEGIQPASHVHHGRPVAKPSAEPRVPQFDRYLHPAGPVAYSAGNYLTADGRNLVALTFDDGPDVVNTPKVLDILHEAGVHATFFLIGLHVERHPDGARRVLAEGHEIGPHGYWHRRMSRMTDEVLRADMTQAMAALRAVAPEAAITWFRPPQGACDARVLAEAARFQLDTIRWTVDPADWKPGRTSAEITDAVLSRLRPGGVVLLHSVHAATVEALPTILREGAARGFQFVTVSEWWAATHPTTPTVAAQNGPPRPERDGATLLPAVAR